MNRRNNCKCNSGCGNTCNKICNVHDLIRSPRTFTPNDALGNLCIIKNSYMAIKAGIFNYLYECSDLYDQVNQNTFVSKIELDHVGDLYRSLVNELLSVFQTATSAKLSDCSNILSFDAIFVKDSEESLSTADASNTAKLCMKDVPVVQYKNFDVAFPRGALTTFFERPGIQLLIDRSSNKVEIRFSMSKQWTPVARDPYGINLNKYYSTRNTPETLSLILCPSIELAKKGDDDDYTVETAGGRDLSGNPVSGFNAFDTRANLRLFLEDILTPTLLNYEDDTYDVNENDILRILGVLDNYIKKTDLAQNSIETKIKLANNLC